jgi:dTDP-4-amino-4,6-dideoxygalactose transaminase
MDPRKLPITKPCFDESDFAAIAGPLRSGWVVQGPNVKRFEELFCNFAGCKHAVATTSCTTALHLGLVAAGIGPGDEVIVPSFTFIATANAVEYCGSRPIFCDIDLRTFNIDVNKIESLITPKTKAIVPVSLFGLPADLNMIEEICHRRNLILFEDAACAIGATINGKHVGNWGIGGAFSFHPRKAISTGEGGMLATNDQVIADKVRALRDHGASKSDLQRHVEKGGSLLPQFNVLGYNYRMTDIQGALGVSQMGKLGKILSGRIRGAGYYNDILNDVPFVLTPAVPQTFTHAYQSYVVLLTDTSPKLPAFGEAEDLNRKRNALMMGLEAKGITVRQGTHAVHTLGFYKSKYGLKDSDFPNSYMADRLSITLPLFYDLTKDDAMYVKDALLELHK